MPKPAYVTIHMINADNMAPRAKLIRPARPLTNQSGKGRSNKGAASSMAPPLIMIAGHGRTRTAALSAINAAALAAMSVVQMITVPLAVRSRSLRNSAGKWPLTVSPKSATNAIVIANSDNSSASSIMIGRFPLYGGVRLAQLDLTAFGIS